MSIIDWAEREVAIACKNENPDRKEGEWDYGCAIYESALKAYKCLSEDDHSGFSWNMTKQVLMRLMEGKPLTPIEDTDDIWNERGLPTDAEQKRSYQCKRMSSLFKDVYPDGRIEYHDVNRVSVIDIDNPNCSWHNGFISKLIHEKYPITMPYIPEDKPYIVYRRDILTDRKNGDYDTFAILYVKRPDGTIDNDVLSYYKESEDGYVLISHDEYLARLDMHLDRIKREEVKYSE